MELTLLEGDATTLRAGYSCACGCTPSVAYSRGTDLAEDGCCCGNHFAVGPNAAASLSPRQGFRPELQAFNAPWGERLEAAWLVGPSVHGPSTEPAHHHDHDHDNDHEDGHVGDSAKGARSLDPVCGMTVDTEAARAKGLHSSYEGRDYYFCGKGCMLEFNDDPRRYLDPSYIPSM